MVKKKWIVSPLYDLSFFIFPCFLSLSVYYLYEYFSGIGIENLGEWSLTIYIIFDAFFDSPHIFQGFSRTHKDKKQFLKYKNGFTWGLLFLIVLDIFIFKQGYKEEWMVAFAVFGYYHILKQNMGFIKAYSSKEGGSSLWDLFMDKYMYPFLFISSGANYFMNSKESFLYFLHDYLPEKIFIYSFALGMCVYLIYQLYKGRKIEKELNHYKLAFYTITLITNFIIHLDPTMPLMLIIVMETIYHDVQYQGWIMNYQEKFFKEKDKNIVLRWFLYSILYGVGTSYLIYITTFRFPGFDLIEPIFLSLILFHYISDGYIWKFSKDVELKVLLS